MLLSKKLKESTLASHQALEKNMVGRMRAMRSKQDYLDLLYIFYSYFGGIEKLIEDLQNNTLIPNHADRRKAASLAADIESLGGKVPVLAAMHFLPAITDFEQCLGAMYVMEGSTLGGQIITQMLTKQLGITEGLMFFQGYGSETMSMWQKFKAILDQPGNSPDRITDAANDTFFKFGAWFELYQ